MLSLMCPSCRCYWGRGIGSAVGICNRVAIRGLLLRRSPWLSVASGRGHNIWLTHRSRYRRVPGVTLLEGPTVNFSVWFPLSGSGSGWMLGVVSRPGLRVVYYRYRSHVCVGTANCGPSKSHSEIDSVRGSATTYSGDPEVWRARKLT